MDTYDYGYARGYRDGRNGEAPYNREDTEEAADGYDAGHEDGTLDRERYDDQDAASVRAGSGGGAP